MHIIENEFAASFFFNNFSVNIQNAKLDTTGKTAAGNVRFRHMVKSVKESALVQRITVILQKDASLASTFYLKIKRQTCDIFRFTLLL